MLRNNALFPLPHTCDTPMPTRNVHFFLALMIKLEICVTKQRSLKK